jgi:Caspase domain
MLNEFHFAVVIGINRYPGIRDLGKPRNDARGFREWLISDTGGCVPEENVHLIEATPQEEVSFADALASRPRGDELEKGLIRVHAMLEAQLKNNSKGWRQSRLYVYASGHGIAPADGVGAFQFADADPALGYWDHTEFRELETWYVKTSLFREVILLADCCRERRPLAPAFRPRFNMPRDNYGVGVNSIVAYASEYGEKAFEPPDHEVDRTYGFFTAALLEGLKGGAADLETGEITAHDLAIYVRGWVDAMTAGTKYHQKSRIVGDLAQPIVLRACLGALPRRRRSRTIAFPENFAGTVELMRKRRPTGLTWDAAEGPWRIVLEEDDYQLRPLTAAAHDVVWALPVYAVDCDVRL